MGTINKITQETHYRFLNFFKMDVTHKTGKKSEYYVASRAKDADHMKAVTHKNNPDGVSIYALYGEKHDRIVLVRQYRYPLGGYVYEFPAGLVEEGEAFSTGAVREMKEETGLTFTPIEVDPMFEAPRFTTVGMTDESCAAVYGYAEGEINYKGQEDSEEIEVILADKAEVRRILKEEPVALLASYMMYHFLAAEDGHAFDFLKMSEEA